MKTLLFLNLIFLWAQNDASPTLSPSSPLYITNGGSLALTCEVDQDVASVVWRRNGYSSIQIINVTVCNYSKLSQLDTYNYSVTCDQQRRFRMVKLGVNSSDHNTSWSCLMYSLDNAVLGPSSTVRVLMHVPVDSVQLQNGTELTLIEGKSAVLTCKTDTCRPSAAIYWMKDGNNITNSTTDVTVDNVGNDLFVSTGTLIYTGQRVDHMKNLTCVAYNGLDSSQTSGSMTVIIHYPPDGLPEIEGRVNGSTFTMIENTSQTLTCRIIGGNPLANLSWICVGHISSSSSSGQIVTSEIVLAVDRSAQNQSCTCRSSHELDRNKDVFVLLQVSYPAKIREFVAKGNISEILENSTLELYCRVDSNPYSVISLFFGDVLKSTTRDSRELIHNATAGCLDAGKYICSATNAVMNGTTVSAEINLKVQCQPRLDYRKYISTEYYRALNDNVTLEVNVIAYPEPTDIMWYHRASKTDVWQQVPNQPTSSSGLFSTIAVHLGNHGDFGDYLVNMTNSFGGYGLIFHVIPQKVIEGPVGFQVGAIAGGLGAGAVVAAISIILVILYMRRRNKGEGTTKELNGSSQDRNKSESELVDKPLHGIPGQRFDPSTIDGTTLAEYATVVKPKKKAALVEDPSNLYAQVEKTNNNGKKGSAKEKHGKTSQGEIHQNTDLNGRNKNADTEYENSRCPRKETIDEKVYTNPGVSSKSPLVSQDGLLYADVMLDSPTKTGKVVIRGIENHTEYAEIAYGKRGDPLP